MGTDAASISPLEPARVTENTNRQEQHIVQPGDTLSSIASTYNTTLETLLELNQITNPDLIAAGQVLELPPPPDQITPDLRLLTDGLLVNSPASAGFDVTAFVAAQAGYIRIATDTVPTNRADGLGVDEILTAAEVVARIAQEFSVDPRLLLALLEYRAGWLSNPNPALELQNYPMLSEEASGAINREGLYRQLAWTANELNRGYYGWKYDNRRILEFASGQRLQIASGLNAATVGLQYMLHLANTFDRWQQDVSGTGFYAVYTRYFGEPLANVADPLAGMMPSPELTLPFAAGETWFFTGGAHGGWGSGSAWAAIDFAPPDDRTDGGLCYVSDYTARAVAPGMIARSDKGVVVLDLDGDGNELTGWTILYLHQATDGRIAAGTTVQTGDVIGRPSCEGGFSTATHMHIARRYNGEWLPAHCSLCSNDQTIPRLVLSGWSVVALPGQEYQGYLEKNGERRIAEQGRLTPDNRINQ
ncbi:MAG: LysM peptidoglycan-binding domain-containing protein [Anaerolineae bacterium]|nr:LysM peptidoglycan-binding domain-containing protein [Anaerolineae bacterium]